MSAAKILGGTASGLAGKGKANQTEILAGGKQYVTSGNTTSTIISGKQHLKTKAVDKAAKVYSGGIQYVSKGATAKAAKLYLGGKQHVYHGGKTVKTTAYSGGIEYVHSGGIASATKVKKGGSLIVSSGAKAKALVLAKGGKVKLQKAALTGTAKLNGGTLTIKKTGNTAYKLTSKQAAVISYDIRSVKTGAKAMFTLSNTATARNGFSVVVKASQAKGTYKLSSNLTVAKGTEFTIKVGSKTIGTAKLGKAALVDNSVAYSISKKSNVVSLTIGKAKKAKKPLSLSFRASDAELGKNVSCALASGITITQTAIDAVNKNISYGKFSLSGRNLIFTQTKAYRHASGTDKATQTYSFDVKDANGNATKQDVTVTIADTNPEITVTALANSVPSGTAKSGTWSFGFGGDVPAMKTVTVDGKTLNLGTNTNSIAAVGTYGTLTVKADGTYSYAAKANAAGTDSFAFTVKDTDGDSANASLNVTVKDSTVKPAALTFTTQDADVLANTTDTDSKALAEGVTLTQNAIDAMNAGTTYGQFSLDGNNLVFTQSTAYSHAASENSHTFDTVIFDVTDADGNATTLDVNVTIEDDEPSITATPPDINFLSDSVMATGTWSYTFGADEPMEKSVLIDGNSLTMAPYQSVDVTGSYGTLTVNSDGTYTYTGEPYTYESDNFTFSIIDADGDSQSVVLNVNADMDNTEPSSLALTKSDADAVTYDHADASNENAIGWRSSTPNILYGNAANQIQLQHSYINVSSPIETQKQVVQDSVFREAKLA